MRKAWTPSIVPGGSDHNIYLVMDDFGRLGRVWREADVERTDLETVIQDLLEGQYKSPVGVFGFNSFEGWSRDVSEDAQEIRRRCDLQAQDVPSTLQDFVERHEGTRQLTLLAHLADLERSARAEVKLRIKALAYARSQVDQPSSPKPTEGSGRRTLRTLFRKPFKNEGSETA